MPDLPRKSLSFSWSKSRLVKWAMIKNLEKAAERILKAIEKKEKIILYGDADLDGVTSVIVLSETIQTLGGKFSAVYFPDREIEGYGISQKGLELLKEFSPALFITVDCGISNFEEIKLAKKIGFDVIVVDHHEVIDELPEADIVVDPKQKDDQSGARDLAAVGIVFKLSETLLKDRMSYNLRKSFLELVAIGTIADMMPQTGDNKKFISEGLFSLKDSWRPGIRAFFETAFFKNYPLVQKISKIISILNVRDIENNLPISFKLFTTPSLEEAKEIIFKLSEKNEQRKEKIKQIIEEISELISKQKEPVIFAGEKDWDLGLLSSVASFLVQKTKKPVFVFKKLAEESVGTVRTPTGIDSVILMKKCKDYLITFGGHSQASGFRLRNENLEKFKECLINYFIEIYSKP